MAKMVLMGGEKDGWDCDISSDTRPDVFYAVPNTDEEKIKKTKGTDAKHQLRDQLAVLAYKFDPVSSTGDRFRMNRCQELDKVRQV